MPRKSTSYAKFSTFQKKLEQYINKEVNKMVSNLADKVGETFVQRARERLDRFATIESADGNSASIVKGLEDNITYTKGKSDEKGSTGTIRIKNDKNNLMMYLEYGTGIAGSYNEHPEAGKSGWMYAVNPKHYKRPVGIISNLKYNGYGWFFNKSNDSFIGIDDHTDMVVSHKTYQEVREHIRNGKPVKSYIRKVKDRPDRIISSAVFTQGIKPVRYIYDTKMEILDLISKNKSIGGLKDDLEKINNR